MFSRLNIGPRLIVGFALVLILSTAITIPAIYVQVNGIIAKAEKAELQTLFENIRGRIESEGRLAQALSATMANMGYIKQMFVNDEREALYDALEPAYKVLRSDYDVRQFQFHTPPATSFLRVHKPEKFGDDLSSFRHTVVEVNTSHQGIWGLEKGVAGLGVRGVMPVTNAGEHYGSVEFGMSFGLPFFETIKQNNIERGLEIALHVENQGVFKPFAKTYQGADLSNQALLQSAMSGQFVLERTMLNGKPMAVYAAPVNDYSGKPVGVLEVSINREEYSRAESAVVTTMMVVGGLSLILGMVLAYFISRSISRPLCDAKLAMDNIAEGEGDLTQRLPIHGRDEIAEMADAFNRFASKVQNTVAKVAGSTTQIAAASEEMSAITTQSDAAIQRQKQETDQVVTAINEMAATIREVATNAENAAASATEADQQAKSGREVVTDTVSAINNLATEVKRAGEVIHKLEEDSRSIGTVLDVIKDVAEQTNLLALNAAIEAARAGEQGRGFAVVADEVRTLASRTQESTEEISKIIEGFRGSANEAVSVMEQGQNEAEKSVEQAARASEALNIITTAVANINDMNRQIASAAEEQSAVAEEIERNIVSINNATEEASEGSKQTAISSNELARLSNDLQTQVNQFKYD
ncbi:MAG: methyl-accepting chemotaxis protein [Gammaproteobacteria bacterium]|nr:methyl-accepting chemotaxis protein [Gammaproteobacteria bacterium]